MTVKQFSNYVGFSMKENMCFNVNINMKLLNKAIDLTTVGRNALCSDLIFYLNLNLIECFNIFGKEVRNFDNYDFVFLQFKCKIRTGKETQNRKGKSKSKGKNQNRDAKFKSKNEI